MRLIRQILIITSFLSFCQVPFLSFGQLGISFDIKKPREFEDRVLQSEKSGEKKFTAPRRFIQNTVTHYNYFYNANNTLNRVIEDAKEQQIDDYTRLLSFYNYSLDNTSKNKQQLDSILSRSTTGLVLHDLRNDWADNLYLLMGAAYYLRKDFDSAYLTFQFINWAFAPKEKDGYYRTIGSSVPGSNAISVSTKEKNTIPKKIFSEPPSRNDAFIWQIRTLMAMNAYAEAASLIVTLRNDPKFPSRLDNDLAEVQALWYYNQNSYDSAAAYLEKALSNAPTKKEKARWEYLVAQLYELSNQPESAREYYEKVIGHTTDPVMEIYARLNAIRMNQDEEGKYAEKNIGELQKMARKDKYASYRDIIYFTIGQMELDRGNFDEAVKNILKSTRYINNNEVQRNKAFLFLADMAYEGKKYRQASAFYDSLNLGQDTSRKIQDIVYRRDALREIAKEIDIIDRQDSLLRIAALPEDERKDYVKKLVRQLRKQQGLKEEEKTGTLLPINPAEETQTDLFSNNAAKGEWYFYNLVLRTKGAADFKTKWGNRPNTDNWRRLSEATKAAAKPSMGDRGGMVLPENVIPKNTELSFDAFYDNLPLTEEKKYIAEDSVSQSMFRLGKGYAEKIEDWNTAIDTLESLRLHFPAFSNMEEALFTLFYCYTKTGNQQKADEIKKQMQGKFASGRLTSIVTTGKDPEKEKEGKDPVITGMYSHIYDLFIEGRFQEADSAKKAADSLYGANYWTPQLLYIEAVYHIRQREDSVALHSLQTIVSKYPDNALAERSKLLMGVLSRRSEIEKELTEYKMKDEPEDSIIKKETPVAPADRVVSNPVQKTDSTAKKPVTDNKPANQSDPTVIVNPSGDTVLNKAAAKPLDYAYNESGKYYAVIYLNKVDLLWGNEATNSFKRYNSSNADTRNLATSITQIDADNKLMLVGEFANAGEAVQYIVTVKPLASTKIIPWMTASKYSFFVISEANLNVLKEKKNIAEYQMFITRIFPGKF